MGEKQLCFSRTSKPIRLVGCSSHHSCGRCACVSTWAQDKSQQIFRETRGYLQVKLNVFSEKRARNPRDIIPEKYPAARKSTHLFPKKKKPYPAPRRPDIL